MDMVRFRNTNTSLDKYHEILRKEKFNIEYFWPKYIELNCHATDCVSTKEYVTFHF